jgi:exosortase
MKRSHLPSFVIPIFATLLFALLTWPIWHWLYGEWLGNDYYSHGLLIGPVALFLAVQRIRNDPSFRWQAGQGSNVALLFLAASLLIFLYFLNIKAYYLAAFATVSMIASLVWAFSGWAVLQKLLFPIGYLLLMIPLPFIERSTLPLAMFTGVCSGALVRFFGLAVTIVGNAVTLPNANLVIGAQCSGVNSLIALTALMVLAAYLLQGPWWGRVALVAFAVPLAMLGNILRVASLLVVARFYGADTAFTYYHDYSGLVFFLLIFLLMFPLTRLLQTHTLRLDVI